jgi:hypothetical protein
MEEQTTQQIPNRRQRRAMLKQQGILRHLSKLPFLGETRTNFRAKNLETGKQIHSNLTERIEKENADRLEVILNGLKIDWEQRGFNKKEIEMLEEAWALTTIKDKETYREDKKKAKSLRKEAKNLLASRTK